MTDNSTWKKFERRVAELFRTRRNPLSGSMSGHTASDSRHPKLYIECKLAAKLAIWTLWRDTWKKAHAEGKLPVVCQQQKHGAGFLVTVHSDHFEQVARQFLVDAGYSIYEHSPQVSGWPSRGSLPTPGRENL